MLTSENIFVVFTVVIVFDDKMPTDKVREYRIYLIRRLRKLMDMKNA